MAAGDVVALPRDAGHGGRWADELPFIADCCDELVLDLTRLDFAEPLFNVRLAACLDRQAGAGRRVCVLPPSNQHVANYMSRMAVDAGLPAGCDFRLPRVIARDRRDVLIPVTRLTTVEEVEPLGERFADLLAGRQLSRTARGVADALVLSLSELCDNAATHGHSAFGAYVAAQRYKGSRTVLAIGDQGVGIPAHLRRTRRNLLDDGPALAWATERGVSGTADPDRGEGYGAILATLGNIAPPRAALHIWSARGRLSLALSHGIVSQRAGRTVAETTPGAWVVVEISTS